MKPRMEQLTLWRFMPYPTPDWEKCFKECVHFEESPPDYFPATKVKRCTYINQYGTGGGQFVMKTDINGSVRMYCKHFKKKGTE